MNCSSRSVGSRNWLKEKADQTDTNDVNDCAADAAHDVDDDAADAVHDVDDAAHDDNDSHRAVTLWVVCITTKCTEQSGHCSASK